MRKLQALAVGEPVDVLAVVDVGDRSLGATEVRVAPSAVGLNFLDIMLCRGTYPNNPPPPVTPGVEVAGTVVECGSDAAAWLGRNVIACPTLPEGALGERVVVDQSLVFDRPADIDATIAAALPVTYQTAWFALERSGVAKGDTVLIHAAAGGVGIAATELAASRGARVIAVAGGARKLDVCRDHGAWVMADHHEVDFADVVRDETNGHGVDVVIDMVGGDTFSRSLDCLAVDGRIVAVGAAGGPPPLVDPMNLMARNISVVGLSWGSTYPFTARTTVAAVYQTLFDLYRARAIRPEIFDVVSLGETPAALARLSDRATVGKLVTSIDPRV